jgi:hypothetical protein
MAGVRWFFPGLVAALLLPGCARGYLSFPISKAYGPGADASLRIGSAPPTNASLERLMALRPGDRATSVPPPLVPDSMFAKPNVTGAAPHVQSSEVQAERQAERQANPVPTGWTPFTPAILVDVLLLPFTAPVDLVLWLANDRGIAVRGHVDRSRELSLAGRPQLAYAELLEGVMLDPHHVEARSLLEAHVRLATDAHELALREGMVAASLGRYDVLVAATDADDRGPEYRDRVAVIAGVVSDLAPEHPRVAELVAAATGP